MTNNNIEISLDLLKEIGELLNFYQPHEQFIEGDEYYPTCVACEETPMSHKDDRCLFVKTESVINKIQEILEQKDSV